MIKKTSYILTIIFLLSFFVVPKLSFADALATIEVRSGSLTKTGVILDVVGLDSSKSVTFRVESIEPTKPYGSTTEPLGKTSEVESDDLGYASSPDSDFHDLNPDCHYKASIAYSDSLSNVLNIVLFNTPAEDPIIIGGGDPSTTTTTTTTPTPTATGKPGVLVPCSANCQFNDLMKLVNDVINYVFLVLAVPIAAIMFAYAGILMVTSAGSKESREKAKSIFFNVTLGLFFIGACWLLVHLVFNIVGYKDASWIGL